MRLPAHPQSYREPFKPFVQTCFALEMVKRPLIVTPANLQFQWQREMREKFREHFEMVRGEVLRINYGANPWQEKHQVITSVAWASRIEDARKSLLRSHWDLVIVDEAHRMSASSADKNLCLSIR